MGRNYAIDLIKTISILAVIAIHISTAFLDRSIPFSFNFDVLLFINQYSRFSVPLFFASSGFLLALKYNKAFSASEFFRKRTLRILPSYIFWTLVYYLIVFPHSIKSLLNLKFLSVFLSGGASYQLYFIPAIFVLYLCFPFFIKWQKFFLSKYFLILFFLLSSIYLYFIYLSGFIPPLLPAFRNAMYNMFPFLMGIYTAINIKKVFFLARKHSILIYSGAILFGTLIFSESYILFREFRFDRFLREQWRPSIQLYALLCGIVFTKFYERFLVKKNWEILFLSKYSFGVFFIHVAILELFLEVIDKNKWYGLISFLAVFLGTIILSYGLIWIISKVPKVGKTISAS